MTNAAFDTDSYQQFTYVCTRKEFAITQIAKESTTTQRDNAIRPFRINVPDDDLYQAPETWARRVFPSLIYFHQADRGGHFAAWEEPQLFSEEDRAAFRSLR